MEFLMNVRDLKVPTKDHSYIKQSEFKEDYEPFLRYYKASKEDYIYKVLPRFIETYTTPTKHDFNNCAVLERFEVFLNGAVEVGIELIRSSRPRIIEDQKYEKNDGMLLVGSAQPPDDRRAAHQQPVCNGPGRDGPRKAAAVTKKQRAVMWLILTVLTALFGVYEIQSDVRKVAEVRITAYGPDLDSLKETEVLKQKADDMILNIKDFTDLEEVTCQLKYKKWPELCERVVKTKMLYEDSLDAVRKDICQSVTTSHCPSSGSQFVIVEGPKPDIIEKVRNDMKNYRCNQSFSVDTASCNVKQLSAKPFGFKDLIQLSDMTAILPIIGTVLSFGMFFKWNLKTIVIEFGYMTVVELVEYMVFLALEYNLIPNGVDVQGALPLIQSTFEKLIERV